MQQKVNLMKMSMTTTQGEESKTRQTDTGKQAHVYKREALIFRAQKYDTIGMDNLWGKNKDFFEMKKYFRDI